MESREEKLAKWLDAAIIPQHQDFTALSGSIWPRPSGTSSPRVRVSEDRIGINELSDSFLNPRGVRASDAATTGNEDEAEDKRDASKPWQFRVLSVPRLQAGRQALSIPRPVFQRIQNAWQLHPRTLEVFLSNNGLFTTFTCPNTGREFLILKVASSQSTGFDCVSVTHDRLRRTTYVLYHHLHNEEGVFSTLLATPEHCLDPFFFVSALYRAHQQQIEMRRDTIDMAILAMEHQTGYGTPGQVMDPRRRRRRNSVDNRGRGPVLVEDPKLVLQELSYCQTDLAIIRHAGQCCLECGEWLMQSLNSRLESERRKVADAYSVSQRAVFSMVRDDVEYTRRRSFMLLSQVQQMADRTKSQTAFMLNSITQSDSEYTAAIAIDTKRDSIAMRTISVLGIIYLPATFVATFFSMDMFKWAADEGETLSSPRVSPFMWIYWVVALPLTLVTVFAWRIWARLANDESSKRLTTFRSTSTSRHPRRASSIGSLGSG